MTARQFRTAQEAALHDPLGLMTFPAPNIPRGLFGGNRRRFNAGYTPGRDGSGASGGISLSPPLDPASASGMQPPPISEAPPPPADWKKTLGASLVSQLAPLAANGLQMERMNPAPAMRGGNLANRGLFGSQPTLSADPSQIDKISNRDALPIEGANSKGKKGIDWRMIAGIAGDALLGAVGRPGLYAPMMEARREREWKQRQALADWRRDMAATAYKADLDASKPDYATIGNRRVQIDPPTGESRVLFKAPHGFEDYAATLGYEPGTEEYDRAVQDYILRSSGPTATDFDKELEGVRYGNRVGLEGMRQRNRLQLRGTPTYRQANPAPRSSGRAPTAVNPQTGERMVLRNGKWVSQ